MRRLLKNEWFWVVSLSFLAVFLSLLSTFYEFAQAPKVPSDRQFIMDYGLPGDFNVYINRILQGQEGRWLVKEDLASDFPYDSLLQILYLFLGKVFFVFDPVFVFHLSRVLIGFFWAMGGYFFIRRFVKEKAIRVAALVFFLFSLNFPLWNLTAGRIVFDLHLVGFTEFNPMYRATYIPHLHVSHIFMVLTLLSFVKLWETGRIKYSLLAGIFGFSAGLILPPTLLVAFGIVGVFFLYKALFQKRPFLEVLKKALRSLPFWLISAASLIYLLILLRSYPWKSLQDAVSSNKIVFDVVDYFWALGPISVLGLLGVLVSFLKKKEELIIPSLWILVSLGMVLVFERFSGVQHPTRFIQVAIELPLSILTAYLIWEVGRVFFVVRRIVFSLLIFLVLFPAPFVYAIAYKNRVDFIDAKVRAGWPLVPLDLYIVYPVKDFMEGVYWIKHSTKRSDVVLGSTITGGYVAAYAGNLVYLGHGHQTPFYKDKLSLTKGFYQNLMTFDEAKRFLFENRISYVFFGPEEREWRNGEELKLPFLEKVYEKGRVSVFRSKTLTKSPEAKVVSGM